MSYMQALATAIMEHGGFMSPPLALQLNVLGEGKRRVSNVMRTIHQTKRYDTEYKFIDGYWCLKVNSVGITPNEINFTPSVKLDVDSLVCDGLTISEICAETGMAQSTIFQYCRRMNYNVVNSYFGGTTQQCKKPSDLNPLMARFLGIKL